ncbi:MAG TPA: DUF2076 domain-containing protein [Rhodoblastus sp.]|nr:DUF2076 domain-containing protein [Rhodoblastus sp.]
MSPEERQLLSELFERVRGQASAPRDRDAENFIADAVRAQPYAPYLLSQAVIVQEQALKGADQKIQDLQAQIGQLQAQMQAQSQAAPQGGGFLGGLFGGGARPSPQPGAQPGPQPGPWGAPPQQPQAYAPPPPQPAPSPWGAPQQPPQGGGFLRNALGAAAGVAGGVLLADSLKGLFSGGGHGSGLFGGGAGQGLGGGETVVNNFFENPPGGAPPAEIDNSSADDADYSDADYSGDDYSGDDYSSDV